MFVCLYIYILYLHFKCYSLSSFSLCNCPPTLSPLPLVMHTHFPVLSFLYTGALSLHRTKDYSSHWCLARPPSTTYAAGVMGPSCVQFGWWFSPWELWQYWLVHIVVPPMGLQNLSAPWVLSLVPPLGTLCLVQRLAESIHLCSYQTVIEPLRRQLNQGPVSKHLLESIILSGFGDCIWDGSPGGSVSGWLFLQSLFHTLSL